MIEEEYKSMENWIWDKPHIDSSECWCHPTLFFEGLGEFGDVWVHKGPMDELPPAGVLIAALADAIRGWSDED